MTCSDVAKVLELFVDGELPGRTMRDVAVHLSRCQACARSNEGFEQLQEMVRATVVAEVGEPDGEAFWMAIAPRLTGGRPPLGVRLRGVAGRVVARRAPTPLWAAAGIAAAAVVAAAAFLWPGGAERGGEVARRPGVEQARIDSLDARGGVRVWNDPHSDAIVIWVADDGGLSAERVEP
jgi:anti-sigma factor RsiW